MWASSAISGVFEPPVIGHDGVKYIGVDGGHAHVICRIPFDSTYADVIMNQAVLDEVTDIEDDNDDEVDDTFRGIIGRWLWTIERAFAIPIENDVAYLKEEGSEVA